MTIGRILCLILLVKRTNACDDIVSSLTVGDHIEIHVYDDRKIGKHTHSTSFFYTTDNNAQDVERHPDDRNIITIKDPDLKRAECYLWAIIARMKRGTE